MNFKQSRFGQWEPIGEWSLLCSACVDLSTFWHISCGKFMNVNSRTPRLRCSRSHHSPLFLDFFFEKRWADHRWVDPKWSPEGSGPKRDFNTAVLGAALKILSRTKCWKGKLHRTGRRQNFLVKFMVRTRGHRLWEKIMPNAHLQCGSRTNMTQTIPAAPDQAKWYRRQIVQCPFRIFFNGWRHCRLHLRWRVRATLLLLVQEQVQESGNRSFGFPSTLRSGADGEEPEPVFPSRPPPIPEIETVELLSRAHRAIGGLTLTGNSGQAWTPWQNTASLVTETLMEKSSATTRGRAWQDSQDLANAHEKDTRVSG